MYFRWTGHQIELVAIAGKEPEVTVIGGLNTETFEPIGDLADRLTDEEKTELRSLVDRLYMKEGEQAIVDRLADTIRKGREAIAFGGAMVDQGTLDDLREAMSELSEEIEEKRERLA